MLIVLLAGAAFEATGQVVRSECPPGTADARLDVNGVTASVTNNGLQFVDGYEVPAGTGRKSIWLTELMISGVVNGQPYSLWADWHNAQTTPGPFKPGGTQVNDCATFDRIYTVSLGDIHDYDATGVASRDMLEWPHHLGAPVDDGDGVEDNYDLEAGDRPAVKGHQMSWWIMNDTGGRYINRYSGPIGLEFQVSAFAASGPDSAIEYSTLYRFEITNHGAARLDSAYFGQLAEFALGNLDDDFAGSDSALGLAYAYNADDVDEDDVGRGLTPVQLGYGRNPPAIGVAILDGIDTEDGPLPMTNTVSEIQAFRNIRSSRDVHNLMQSILWTRQHVTRGGSGMGFSETPADFMYPDDPPSFWSEERLYPDGSQNHPGYADWMWSTGPFSLDPGERKEIVFAFVWARGSDRYDSITKLKDSVRRVRDAYAAGFEIPLPPRPSNAPIMLSPATQASNQPAEMDLAWTPVEDANRYEVEIRDDYESRNPIIRQQVVAPSTRIRLQPGGLYYWRVRALSAGQAGPWADMSRSFGTGFTTTVAPGPYTFGRFQVPAFLQVQAPGRRDPCLINPGSVYGCREVGGVDVYRRQDVTSNWSLDTQGLGPQASLGRFAGRDFEIRFTDTGSFSAHLATTNRALHVPFEVWDVGDVGPFGVNDTTDDRQLIGSVLSQNGGECYFGFGESDESENPGSWPETDQIAAYYPSAGFEYSDWAAAVGPLIETDPDACPDISSLVDRVDTTLGPTIQGVVFAMDPSSPDYRPEGIPSGNVIRFLTTRPTPIALSSPGYRRSAYGPWVDFWWQVPSDSTRVRFQIATDRSFESPVADKIVVGSHTSLSLPRAGFYYWRVAYAAQPENWSAVWIYIVQSVVANENTDHEFPHRAMIRSAYPNPVSSSGTIDFGLPDFGSATIRLYDLLGREVARIVDQPLGAGWHSVPFQTDALSSGVYLIRLDSDGARDQRSIVVVR